jgi:hypothetical protein
MARVFDTDDVRVVFTLPAAFRPLALVHRRRVFDRVDVKPGDVAFDMPVRVVFKPLTDRATLPVWRPDR